MSSNAPLGAPLASIGSISQQQMPSSSTSGSAASNTIPEIPSVRHMTLFQRVKQARHTIGNMALAASCCFLAVRILSQQQERERLNSECKAAEEELAIANFRHSERVGLLREAVMKEVGKGGKGLAARVDKLFEEAGREKSETIGVVEPTAAPVPKSDGTQTSTVRKKFLV